MAFQNFKNILSLVFAGNEVKQKQGYWHWEEVYFSYIDGTL